MVFDTEVYSNTGGQMSKASSLGQIAQFAAGGKTVPKKKLAEMMMTYGSVYVAQIAMGADFNQTLTALKEAEAYRGPSLIVAYSPCELHNIKGGMINAQKEIKRAVDCGYWPLFRFHPGRRDEGKNPFVLDSKPPQGDFRAFLMGEARFSALARSSPERAERLFVQAEEAAKASRLHLERLQKLYEP